EVARLTEHGLRSVTLGKAKAGMAAAFLLGLVAASAAVLASQMPEAKQPPKPEAEGRRSGPIEPDGKRPRHSDRFGDAPAPGAVARIGSVRWWSGRHPDGPLVFARDGKILVSCDEHKVVRFLDTATGKELRRIDPPGNGYTSFALAPDGLTVITGD